MHAVYNEFSVSRHPLLQGAFGSIDGLNLPYETSDDIEFENATYNGWLHAHFISSVLVFSGTGLIVSGCFNCPGDWHDSHVAQPVYKKLLQDTPHGYYLVADTVFLCGTDQIKGKIRVLMKAGQKLPGAAQALEEHLWFNR
ncbi:hypothetical protein BV25DRAFT_1918728 [Artomyces pyxidatus]|uniref:Uncharacterized protein n=1 Tax=Artomyces pyxidatus TaxID=48021 RepID=A0ACB8SSU7_9AGAM|nr:hypothetical protein BV25DRAFT_1918728 [Artomyces pyxidatus]